MIWNTRFQIIFYFSLFSPSHFVTLSLCHIVTLSHYQSTTKRSEVWKFEPFMDSCRVYTRFQNSKTPHIPIYQVLSSIVAMSDEIITAFPVSMARSKYTTSVCKCCHVFFSHGINQLSILCSSCSSDVGVMHLTRNDLLVHWKETNDYYRFQQSQQSQQIQQTTQRNMNMTTNEKASDSRTTPFVVDPYLFGSMTITEVCTDLEWVEESKCEDDEWESPPPLSRLHRVKDILYSSCSSCSSCSGISHHSTSKHTNHLHNSPKLFKDTYTVYFMIPSIYSRHSMSPRTFQRVQAWIHILFPYMKKEEQHIQVKTHDVPKIPNIPERTDHDGSDISCGGLQSVSIASFMRPLWSTLRLHWYDPSTTYPTSTPSATKPHSHVSIP